MSSKKNHAARSRKTNRYGLYAARHFLRGSLPYEVRQNVFAMLGSAKAKAPAAAEGDVKSSEV